MACLSPRSHAEVELKHAIAIIHGLPERLSALKQRLLDAESAPEAVLRWTVHEVAQELSALVGSSHEESQATRHTPSNRGVDPPSVMKSMATFPEEVKCGTALDGSQLAVAGAGLFPEIWIWDVDTMQCVTKLEGHHGDIYCLTRLPGGSLASGSKDHFIKIWNVAASECVGTLSEHRCSVTCLVALKGGGFLASGSGVLVANGCDDHADRLPNIKIWDVAAARCVATLEGHNGTVTSLAVLDCGQLASGGGDTRIKIWDITAMRLVKILVHDSTVTSLVVLPDGHLVSVGHDEKIQIWDVAAAHRMAMLKDSDEPLFCSNSCCSLVVLDGGLLVIGTAGVLHHTVKIWDLASKRVKTVVDDKFLGGVAFLALLDDGRLVSGSKRGEVTFMHEADVGRSLMT